MIETELLNTRPCGDELWSLNSTGIDPSNVNEIYR